MVESRIIEHPVMFGFDPKANPDSDIAKVFDSYLARTLFLAVLSGCMHLWIPERLGPQCLRLADRLGREGIPSSADALLEKIGVYLPDAPSGLMSPRPDFAKELLPYLRGEADITYEVNLKGARR